MAMQALVLGFGGSGAHILTYLKELIVFKNGALPKTMRFLLFDTIADWQPGKTISILGGKSQEVTATARSHEEGTSLDQKAEYFHLGDRNPSLADIVNRHLRRDDAVETYPHLARWLNATWLNLNVSDDKLNIAEGAAQQRQIGRFGLFQNIEHILPQLKRDMAELKQRGGGATLNVWIVGSSAGGTGAGCLIDAALIARMAAPPQTKVRINGVIVLPDTYTGVEGISKARAYAVFREIDRLQRRGFKTEDDVHDPSGNPYHFAQSYNVSGTYRAIINNKLFDSIFTIGKPCPGEEKRQAFFSSAVAAMDTFLDENCGPRMLEHEVNSDYDLVSFGAARLYIPMKTYEELFAWQEVAAWLEAASAANTSKPGAVHFGSVGDREREAGDRVKRLLPFFETLQGLSTKSREEVSAFAQTLDPKSLVARALQVASSTIGGTDAAAARLADSVPLTYIDPFLSLKEPDEDRVPVDARLVKTYKENRKAKGARESQEASRERFILELDGAAKRYRDMSGAAGSFEQGQRALFELMSKALIARVDEEILREFTSSGLAVSANHPGEGTVLTRLHQELQWITTSEDGGKLNQLREIVNNFIEDLVNQRNSAEKSANSALVDLREARPGLLGGFGDWVDSYQEDVRSRMLAMVRFHQRLELLRLIKRLLESVAERFGLWLRLLDDVLKTLVRVSDGRRPLLEVVNANRKRLEVRLNSLAKDTCALISLEAPEVRDTGMQGFREVLRARATDADGRSLHDAALDGARWEPSIDEQGRPHITLVYKFEGEERRVSRRDLAEINLHLKDIFLPRISSKLNGVNIFEYLEHVKKTVGFSTEKMMGRLNDAATVLAETSKAAEAKLVYKNPGDVNQQTLAEALQGALGKLTGVRATDSENQHSDVNSLTLLKTVKPNPDEIEDLHACSEDYLDKLRRATMGKADHDTPIRRAQVYHLLRGEQEAWYIERQLSRKSSTLFRVSDLLPPRLVRLLEDPDRIKAFVDGVATGVIAYEGGNWLFRDRIAKKELRLVTQSANLMRAAVVFVIQQVEDRPNSTEHLSLTNAQKSAVQAAQEKGLVKTEMVQAFVNGTELEDLLNNHIRQTGAPESRDFQDAEQIKRGLSRIFRFYGDPEVRTTLAARAEL